MDNIDRKSNSQQQEFSDRNAEAAGGQHASAQSQKQIAGRFEEEEKTAAGEPVGGRGYPRRTTTTDHHILRMAANASPEHQHPHLVDEALRALDGEIMPSRMRAKGSVYEQMNRSIGGTTDENNDSFHNRSLSNLSGHHQRKQTNPNNVSGISSNQDISMLSANKQGGAERASCPQRSKTKKDLDAKLLSLNDIMQEAAEQSQQHNSQAARSHHKIDAEQEQRILERARAFCQGRDGRQVPNQEERPPMTFQVENMLRKCPDMSGISSIPNTRITNSHNTGNTTEMMMINSISMSLAGGNLDAEQQPGSDQNQSHDSQPVVEAANEDDDFQFQMVDVERVVNQDMMADELKCRICHGILMHPMECKQCENCFCMNCLQKWLLESGHCPFKCAEEPDFKLKPHKIIRNMLSKLKITCKNKPLGCPKELDYDKLEIHEEHECDFLKKPCPEKSAGCTAMLGKDELEKHAKECQYVNVECTYCHELYRRQDLRQHMYDCQMAVMTCPHCLQQFQKKAYAIHVDAQCNENYIHCGRCQASFKRKYKDYHDCVRHLQNQQRTMQEQIKLMKQELQTKDELMVTMRTTFTQKLNAITQKINMYDEMFAQLQIKQLPGDKKQGEEL